MDLPHKILNIFQTILKTTPPEVFNSTSFVSVLSIFRDILITLGYNYDIINLVMMLVRIAWDVFQFILKWWRGSRQAYIEYQQD